MIRKSLNDYVSAYRELLKVGDVQIAYAELVKYVQKLRTEFSKDLANGYSVGNVLQGYMDYTYFYVTNDYLKSKKLKLGVVLNHTEANFEIWLLGQTKDVQEEYWKLLKNTKWIKGPNIPKYSVFDVVLVNNPNFDDLGKLTDELGRKFVLVSDEIVSLLKRFS